MDWQRPISLCGQVGEGFALPREPGGLPYQRSLLGLCEMRKTQERIQFTLKAGKPLRN